MIGASQAHVSSVASALLRVSMSILILKQIKFCEDRVLAVGLKDIVILASGSFIFWYGA